MESAVKLNRLLLKLLLLCHSDIQERQGKIKLSWGNLREQKVLESVFLWLSKSLHSGNNYGAASGIYRVQY